jgi:hypothetical protein
MAPQTYESTLIQGGARITGRVSDAQGAVIPRAVVKAYDADGTVVGEATANEQGVYDLQGLPDGSVRLEIEMPGFKRAVINDVVASSAKASVRDARLEVGAVTESVMVAESVPNLNTSTSQTSGRNAGSGSRLGNGDSYALNKRAAPPARARLMNRDEQSMIRTQVPTAATAQGLGDLFEYKLK